MKLTRPTWIFLGMSLMLVVISLVRLFWRLYAYPDLSIVANGSLGLAPLGWTEIMVVLPFWALLLAVLLAVMGRADFDGPGRRKQLVSQTLLLTAAGVAIMFCSVESIDRLSLGGLFAAIGIAIAAPLIVDVFVSKQTDLAEAWRRLRYVPVVLVGVIVPLIAVRWMLLRWPEPPVTSPITVLVLLVVALIQATAIRQSLGRPMGVDDATGSPRLQRIVAASAAAVILLPGAAAAVIAVTANLPQVWFRDGWSALAAGWPAGRHPVFAHGNGFITDCLDDRCESADTIRIGFAFVEDRLSYPTAAIAADGAVTIVNGEQLIHCDAGRSACRKVSPVTLKGAALSAVTVSANGAVVLGAAWVVSANETTTWLKLAIVQCADPYCAEVTVADLGQMETGVLETYNSQIRIGIGEAGIPGLIVFGKDTFWVGHCPAAGCRLSKATEAHQHQEMLDLHGWPYQRRAAHVDSGAEMAVGKEGYYALGFMSARAEAIQHMSTSSGDALLICADSRCGEVKRRVFLPVPFVPYPFDLHSPPWVYKDPIAVHPDGRVVLVNNYLLRLYVVER